MSKAERNITNLKFQNYEFSEFQNHLQHVPVESLVITFADNRRLDIGCLCYSIRDKSKSIPKNVETSSLRVERTQPIRRVIASVAEKYYLGGSIETAYSYMTQIIGAANWFDQNGHSNYLSSATDYKSALDSYTIHLTKRISETQDLVESTGRQLQSSALGFGLIAFPQATTNFRDDLPLITFYNDGVEKTAAPSADELADYLTPCHYIFEGVTDFILGAKSFPYRIPYKDTEALLLPSDYPISSPWVAQKRKRTKSSIAWDYDTGGVIDLRDSINKSNMARHQLIYKRDYALKLIENANTDFNHPKRMWLAALAHNAFVSLFVANTGMNEAPLRSLLWTGDYEISKGSSAGFVVIKLRAGSLEQTFEIQKVFLKSFKKFVKLREYLCARQHSDFLFVNYSKSKGVQNCRIQGSLINTTSIQIANFIDPSFKVISYRKLRKYKSVYLLSKKHGIDIVAALMQSSASTILKSYAQAEERTAIDEISATLTYVVSILDGNKQLATPAGDCSGEQPSEATTPPVDYMPNCNNVVGCIFCNEFRLHADEESVRKILSMRFVTSERLSACTDVDHFKSIHGPVIDRIDRIMEDICEVRPEMKELIERITSEIQNEYKLSQYWETIHERLIKIKAI